VSQALQALVILPMLSSLAVAWHRLLLRGEHVEGRYFRFDSVVLGYAAMFFLIGLLPGVPQYLGQIYAALSQPATAMQPSTVGVALSSLGSLLSIVIWFFSTRLIMVLPARAIGRDDVTVGVAWAGTRRNTWRLFWGYFFCLLPVALLGSVLAMWLVFSAPSRALVTVVWTILTLLWALFGMVGVGFLSLAFRYFFERSP
jgi:hypothetical protein